MAGEYTINIATTGGEALAIAGTFLSLDYTLATNTPGELTLTLPATFNYRLLGPDARLTVIRDNQVVGNTCWFVQESWIEFSNNAYTIGVAAESALSLLRRRIVGYADGTAQANKTAVADDILKALVRENLGASAVAARDLTPYLAVQGDAARSVSLTMQAAWDNVLDVARDIADATKHSGTAAQLLFFDIELLDPQSGSMEFRTFVEQRGNNHSAAGPRPVLFSPESGNVEQAERRYVYRDEVTWVYAGDSGQGTDRIVDDSGDAVRAGRGIFGRREAFHNAGDTATPGDAIPAVLAAGRPRKTVTASLVDTPDTRYGTHWNHGDTVNLVFAGETGDYRINSLSVSVRDGTETIQAVLETDDVYA